MVAFHPEYIVDGDSHPKAVVLPYDEWQSILAELEELDDIRAYDAAKEGDDEEVPFEEAMQEIEQGMEE